MLNDDIVWLAGLFEGEGCISVEPAKNPGWAQKVKLMLGMDDEDVVRECQKVTQRGTVREVRREGYNPHWLWQVQDRASVEYLLTAMLPRFKSRRTAKAHEALTALQTGTRRKLVAECGTTGGYDRHKRHGEPTCQPCREARRLYYAARRG